MLGALVLHNELPLHTSDPWLHMCLPSPIVRTLDQDPRFHLDWAFTFQGLSDGILFTAIGEELRKITFALRIIFIGCRCKVPLILVESE